MSCATISEVRAGEARALARGERTAALDFLGRRPLSNFIAAGMLRDGGESDPALRGAFYGCFTGRGLEGVALLGHLVLPDGSEAALRAFARLAAESPAVRVSKVFGEARAVEPFAEAFAASGPRALPRRDDSHLLLTLEEACAGAALAGLRRARAEEIDEVADAHAALHAELFGGSDPRAGDFAAFRERVRSRVEAGRVWLARDAGGVAFKLDVAAETPDVVYLEGVWARPDLRHRGVGSSALRGVCRHALRRRKKVCLFADAHSHRSLSFYSRVGFRPASTFRLLHYATSN